MMVGVPEGDTVWRTAQRLHQALAGESLLIGELRVPTYATDNLAGLRVENVTPRGKHLLIRLSDQRTLHNHLRMDGAWWIYRTVGGRRVQHQNEIRAILGNAVWRAYGFRLHNLELLPTAAEDRIVGHLGPDILGPDWDADEAVRRIAGDGDGTRTIAEALLDQRNLAGIGNLYANEIAFLHGITPWTPVSDVPDLDAVIATAHRLMSANRDNPEQSTTGNLRRDESHWVYRRRDQLCRRCHTPIRESTVGPAPYQRVAFWCPRCQRGPTKSTG